MFRHVLLGIGASFVASGFIAWGMLQVKELMMPIGDWIRAINERNRAKWREEGRQQGRSEGREEGRSEGREEGRSEGREEGRNQGYAMGYRDAQQGRPEQPPTPFNDQTPSAD